MWIVSKNPWVDAALLEWRRAAKGSRGLRADADEVSLGTGSQDGVDPDRLIPDGTPVFSSTTGVHIFLVIDERALLEKWVPILACGGTSWRRRSAKSTVRFRHQAQEESKWRQGAFTVRVAGEVEVVRN